MKKSPLIRPKRFEIFEDTSTTGLVLQLEKFLSENPNVDILDVGYSVQKPQGKEHFKNSGSYSCLLFYEVKP